MKICFFSLCETNHPGLCSMSKWIHFKCQTQWAVCCSPAGSPPCSRVLYHFTVIPLSTLLFTHPPSLFLSCCPLIPRSCPSLSCLYSVITPQSPPSVSISDTSTPPFRMRGFSDRLVLPLLRHEIACSPPSGSRRRCSTVAVRQRKIHDANNLCVRASSCCRGVL